MNMTQHEERSAAESESVVSGQEVGPLRDYRDEVPDDLFSDHESWEKELDKQKPILESLGSGKAMGPGSCGIKRPNHRRV